jgi:carbon-monoxide dehydrogenase medium subunit
VADARIALGCLAPTIVRARLAEAALIGGSLEAASRAAAAEASLADAAPIGDVRGSAAYRRTTLAALVRAGLERLADGREAEGFPARPVLLQTAGGQRPTVAPFTGTVVATINGERRELADVSRKTLMNALRDEAGLTGAKEGCAEGECGACTVWLDGAAVMSCLVPAVAAHGAEITTIEGLADGETLHPLQQAYIECGAVQCGFCIPGMLMAGAKLLDERRRPSLDEHQAAISGNLCRCTGYRKILDAMTEAADVLAAREPLAPAPV